MQSNNILQTIEEILYQSCKTYFEENNSDFAISESVTADLQLTKDNQYGDFTSNIAMRLSKSSGVAPNLLAQGLVGVFTKKVKTSLLSHTIGKVESKGGFINFWLSDKYFAVLLRLIQKQKNSFGKNNDGTGKKINLEFVSANPTGPLTIAHGRQAAIGDTLSRILRFNGYDVTNEYYLNDFGRQIKLLGMSVEVRYRNLLGIDEDMPEDGYMGEYIKDIAKQMISEKGNTLLTQDEKSEQYFKQFSVDYIMKLIHQDLNDFGVEFNTWTSQASIEGKDEVTKVLSTLKDNGYIYEEDGATWFNSTKFEDDKDRVVIKNDGSYTYLAPDIAYHNDKFKRGYTKLIDLLGPDHHGYINRMKAAVQALGHDAESLDILIVQLVTLLRGGKTVSMSTRRGEFITLKEIIDEIGKDVARFFFLSRRLDSHLDFDIELAKKESSENPVFYIQYAHARICSIQKYGKKNYVKLLFQRTDLSKLVEKEEKMLIRKLSEFPVAVKASADALEPNRIVVYLNELARLFHSFYTQCRVVSDDHALTKARLYLVDSVRIILANGLKLLNISLPEKM